MKKFTLKIIFGDNSSVDIYHNVDYVEFDALDRGSTSDVIEWGIYSNRGEVSFFDIDGTVEPLLKQNIEGHTKVEIYLSSEAFDRKCATFYVEDYTYERDTQKITMMLHDVLTEWQSVMMDDIFIFEQKSVVEVIATVWSAATSKYPFLNKEGLAYDSSAMVQVNNCHIDCPHLTSNSLWANMDKLCKISMCRICVNEEGKPRVYYDNGNKTPIVIRPNNIISVTNETGWEKTKIVSANISVKDRTKHIGEEVAFASYSIFDYTTTPRLSNVGGQQAVINTTNWFFVGDNKEINPNVSVSQMLWNGETELQGAKIKFEVPVAANTHSVTFHSTEVSWRDEANASQVYGSQTVSQEEQETLELEFDKKKATVYMSLELKRVFELGNMVVLTARTSIKGNFYTDAPDITYITHSSNSTSPLSPTEIPSNDLMQQKNVYAPVVTDLSPPLYTRILREVVSRYENGVDCCEMECTFEDYYREDGNKVIDGSGIVQPIQGFSRYDTVIPYIQKNHQTVPYKTDANGNPKVFKIIGMKYRYNGVVRQTLCLQENTYYNE